MYNKIHFINIAKCGKEIIGGVSYYVTTVLIGRSTLEIDIYSN